MWNDLRMQERAHLIRMAVRGGMTNLDDIRSMYNSFAEGGQMDGRPTFDEWYNTVPEDRNDTVHYDLRRAYDVVPQEQLERWRTAIPGSETPNSLNYIDENGVYPNHLPSVGYNPETNIYDFIKKKDHSSVQEELKWFNSPDGEWLRDTHKLDSIGDYYRYVPKNDIQ